MLKSRWPTKRMWSRWWYYPKEPIHHNGGSHNRGVSYERWLYDQSSTYILRRLKVWAGPPTNEKWWLDQTQALFYALLKVLNDVDSMFEKQIQTIFEFLEIFRSNVLAFKS